MQRQQITNQTSIYAFVGWISTVFAYVAFLMWAFIPESYLNGLGITYYPSKYYAIALPAYTLVSYMFIQVVYIGINMINTYDPSDVRTVRDSHTRHCDPKQLYNAFAPHGIGLMSSNSSSNEKDHRTGGSQSQLHQSRNEIVVDPSSQKLQRGNVDSDNLDDIARHATPSNSNHVSLPGLSDKYMNVTSTPSSTRVGGDANSYETVPEIGDIHPLEITRLRIK